MGAKIRSGGRFHIMGANGQPANGWKVETFNAGSAGVLGTDNKATYTDNTLGTAHPNPIILDARGEAEVWWLGTYLIKVYDESDNLIYSLDYFGAGEDPAVDTEVAPLNGSFEIDDNGDGTPNNWTLTPDETDNINKDDTESYHGQSCLGFVGTTTGGGTAESDKFSVTPGETRELSFSYKSTAANTLNSVDVKWYNHAGTLLSTSNLYSEGAANPTAWTEKMAGVTVPANAVEATILITGVNSGGTTVNATTKFDNIRFKRIGSTVIEEVVSGNANRLRVTSVATGNPVTVGPVGDDANITANASGKGTGKFNIDGNAGTSTQWQTTRTIQATGDVTAPAQNINGTGNVSLPMTIAPLAVDTTELAAGAVERAKIQTATVSLSGTINQAAVVPITMNPYAFFPMIHTTEVYSSDITITGHKTDGASADNPRFAFFGSGLGVAESETYDVDYRYISA